MRGSAKWVMVSAVAVMGAGAPVRAALNVFLDFNAGWVTELNGATTLAGVTAFSAGERTTLQNNILAQLRAIYAGYDLNFTTVDPGGTRDRINFGATTTSTSTYGSAPVNVGNSSIGQTASVFARNFDVALETSDARATQIAEVSTQLAGTAAHEYGHTLGLFHYHSYGDPRITPATFSNTQGFQNTHIMATGQTGLSEAQRETARTFSLWERVLLDITGGTRFGGTSIVTSPLTFTAEAGGDVGGTAATAATLAFATGSSSRRPISIRDGEMDGSLADVDLYRFTVTSPTFVAAEVFSDSQFSSEFDARVRLLAADGITQLTFSDNISYSGNTFANGDPTTVDDTDPWLWNFPVGPGTYFLEVSQSGTPNFTASVGADYTLVVALIPEPGGVGLMVSTASVLAGWRPRRGMMR